MKTHNHNGLVLWLLVLAVWLFLRFFWPFPQLVWWQTMGLLYGVLIVGAMIVIGGKLRHVLDPEDAIYADSTGGWHWRRWWLMIPILIAMWAVSIGLSAALGAVGTMGLKWLTFPK